MSRTLVIGDIHGGLKALIQVLERAQVTTHDQLIFLGDYVDGWTDTVNLIDFLIELNKTHSCIFMKGNHEEMVLRWLKKEEDNDVWRFHGGQVTVDCYALVSEEVITKHIDFLSNLQEYHIDAENRLFVHAGFSNQRGVTAEFFKPLFWWDRTLWETALILDPALPITDLRYPVRFTLYKEIFIGHTPVTRFNEITPMHCANVWNIDTGAAFKGKLTIMDVNTKAYWQSDPLPDLYPNEKGRNS